ncbi:alpha/beta hydrolase [Candidatus Pacearchaeota archaeon]|nr:alpha/beta hydrolase [Candidatus Pacearchaeota archaeon]
MEKKKQPKIKLFSPKKLLFILFLLIILLFLFLFGTKIYLFYNLLIGNDVLVRVNLDKENLFLSHDQSDSIKIKTDIIANPFCTVYCNYTFADLSYNQTIKSDSFSLKTISPITNEFTLTSPKTGKGQKLYRFEINCNSKKTYLCDTTEEIKSRTLLITLNYNLTSEEIEFKEMSKNKLISMLDLLEDIILNQINFESIITKFNNSVDSSTINKSNYVKTSVIELNSSIFNAIFLWQAQDYESLQQGLPKLSELVNSTSVSFNLLKSEISNLIYDYNYQINQTNKLRQRIALLSTSNFTMENITENISLPKIIADFNNLSLYFDNISINNRKILIFSLENKTSELEKIKTSNVSNVSETILIFNRTIIIIPPINSTTPIIINEPTEKCCLFGNCKDCCDDTCSNNPSKFPVVFIHGHKFNNDISADSNLHAFEDIQKKLETDYINAGSVFVSKNSIPGIWGKANYPVTITTSYYFDTLIESKGETILESQQDSLDTYALRLNDLIKEIKKRTGRDKVIIVSHSMGGLVARKYLQIFGEKDIYKLVLVMVPNKGISGDILTYCSILGSKTECNDMNKDSLFMNKLNNADTPKIPVYNIIGIGCDMDGEQGDGIVKNSTAYLDWAKNYYLTGTCDNRRFEYFHTEITNPIKYPEFLNIIKKLLNTTDSNSMVISNSSVSL